MAVTMYDDINLALIPANAEAVAGYVNGRWPTYDTVVKRWPHAHHLSIAVTSHADADCLDVEPGDATNDVAAAWVKRQQARGIKRPVVYTSVSNAQALVNVLNKAGISRTQFRLWTAHYTGKEHFCNAYCGFGLMTPADATQWTDRALGRSLDQSVCRNDFFDTAPKPTPPPLPKSPKLFPKPPSPMPAWWWQWADWRRTADVWKRPMGPRPASAPRRIPLWAWGALIAYNRKYPPA